MPTQRSRKLCSKKRKVSRNRMRGGAVDAITGKHILGTNFDTDVFESVRIQKYPL